MHGVIINIYLLNGFNLDLNKHQSEHISKVNNIRLRAESQSNVNSDVFTY